MNEALPDLYPTLDFSRVRLRRLLSDSGSLPFIVGLPQPQLNSLLPTRGRKPSVGDKAEFLDG